jgi:hypothetical protein
MGLRAIGESEAADERAGKRAGAVTDGQAQVKPAGKQPPDITGRPMTGRIVRISRAHASGFILAASGRPYFRRADTDNTFADLDVGDRVTFEWADDKVSGPRAVRPESQAVNRTHCRRRRHATHRST